MLKYTNQFGILLQTNLVSECQKEATPGSIIPLLRFLFLLKKIFFLSFVFLGPHLWHMELPKLGV